MRIITRFFSTIAQFYKRVEKRRETDGSPRSARDSSVPSKLLRSEETSKRFSVLSQRGASRSKRADINACLEVENTCALTHIREVVSTWR